MSDSDDEPLSKRVVKKPAQGDSAAVKDELASPAKPGDVKPAAEVKAEAKDDSSDDDELPLAMSRKAKAPAKAKAEAKAKVDTKPKAEPKKAAKPVATKGRGKKDAGDGPSSSGAANGDVKVKREKKEYSLPGQTRDTPPETDPLRKFYTSLLQQRPDSEMAKKWCLQCGLLEQDEAEQVLRDLGKSPAKPAAKPRATPSKAPSKRPAVKAEPKGEAEAKRPRAKITYEDASDDEEEEEEKKPKATTKRAAAAKKKAVEESEEEESDDDKPIAKKARAAPAPKRAAAKESAKKVVDEDSDDDDDDMPLAAIKRSKA